MGALKNMLKHILPPPVNSFNRELDVLKEYMHEINDNLKTNRQYIQEVNANLEASKRALEANKKEMSQLCRQVMTLWEGVLRTQPRPRLDAIVLNILDHCNLRCKGCDHFASIAEERFVALDDICRDLERLSELTCQRVCRICVMGGEPLLHPKLKKILSETRLYFPQTLVQLFTNGILLLKQDNNFWQVCHDNNVEIVVTKYPIDLDFERIEQTARDLGVHFKYYGRTGETVKTSYKMPMDVSGQQDPVKSFWNCFHVNNCPLLMEGKIYPCTVSPNACHFNKKFGTAMELEEGDWLDIYEINDANEIYRFLSTPKPFCRYCRTIERTFGHPWERSKQQIDEWT